jgi:hypothetical protein
VRDSNEVDQQHGQRHLHYRSMVGDGEDAAAEPPAAAAAAVHLSAAAGPVVRRIAAASPPKSSSRGKHPCRSASKRAARDSSSDGRWRYMPMRLTTTTSKQRQRLSYTHFKSASMSEKVVISPRVISNGTRDRRPNADTNQRLSLAIAGVFVSLPSQSGMLDGRSPEEGNDEKKTANATHPCCCFAGRVWIAKWKRCSRRRKDDEDVTQ